MSKPGTKRLSYFRGNKTKKYLSSGCHDVSDDDDVNYWYTASYFMDQKVVDLNACFILCFKMFYVSKFLFVKCLLKYAWWLWREHTRLEGFKWPWLHLHGLLVNVILGFVFVFGSYTESKWSSVLDRWYDWKIYMSVWKI